MPKKEKTKIVVRDRVAENICDLSLSELTEVPVSQIASFKRVNVLDLSSNRLKTLSKNFLTLTRLVRLDLSKNQLKSLPEDFGHLHSLRHLDLYDNNLEYLPLTFGELINLRYLDLKGNPLVPALAQIVGLCSTTKECQDSARKTVEFMASMQIEAENIRTQQVEEAEAEEQEREGNEEVDESNLYDEAVGGDENINSDYNQNMHDNRNMQTQQKSKKSSKKGKSKNSKNNHNSSGTSKSVQTLPVQITSCSVKGARGNGRGKNNGSGGGGGAGGGNNSTKIPRSRTRTLQSTALSSILTFFILLLANVFIIYLVMFKNPEIAEFIVNIIPQQYRNWVAEKTEIFRLHVTDWISHFITPPDEN